MGTKKRFQIKKKQVLKRKVRREKIAKAGGNPNDFYVDGFCIGTPNK